MKNIKKIYNLINEPKGNVYSQLISYSLKECSSFLFVLRPSVSMDAETQKIIKDLKPYMLKKEAQSEWPGTKLIDNTALVYHFQLNKVTAKYLTSATTSLYSWIHPNFPEDLCLLRSDNTPWLVTIAYEKDGYLELTEEEKEELQESVPGLLLSEHTVNKVD